MWFVYWHKFANSGLWEYKNKATAYQVAKDLAKQEDVYRVTVLESKCWETIKSSE